MKRKVVVSPNKRRKNRTGFLHQFSEKSYHLITNYSSSIAKIYVFKMVISIKERLENVKLRV